MGRAFEYRRAAKEKRWATMSRIFPKVSRAITMAAKEGGPDPETNSKLRLAIQAAKAANMPKDNIQRAIQRGAGGAEGDHYEEVRYEGYGINGAAVIVDCMTDNRTRTVAEVRHAFAKNGGNLGQEGSVAFMFKHCGQFLFAPGTPEDKVMEAALEAGAEDVSTDEEGMVEVICAPCDYAALREAFATAGLKPDVDDLIMKAHNEIEFSGEAAIKMQKLLHALEALDDVQEVYTNVVIDEAQ